jgi:hypothetical protein
MTTSESHVQWWAGIINSVKTPLGFFTLVVLALQGVLIVLVAKANATDRRILIVGMIVLLLACGLAVFMLAYRKPTSAQAAGAGGPVAQPPSFDATIAVMESTITQLEQNGCQMANYYRVQGDLQRLLDGLYSGLLYVAGAVPTGKIEATLYGNLMDWDESKRALRVRYFNGPYNDEIICRAFPLDGPKQGVASKAVSTGQIQYRNEMADELKEKGESLLKAMMSIPVRIGDAGPPQAGMIAAINVDSTVAGVFPVSLRSELDPLERRARDVASLVQRVNLLRATLVRAASPV